MTTTPSPTNDQLFDILTTALEGGYAEEFEVLEHTRRDEDAVIVSAKVKQAEGYETGNLPEDWTETLDAATLRTGLIRYAEWIRTQDPERKSYLGEQFTEGERDGWECLDAIGADAVLQFACFREVVFG